MAIVHECPTCHCCVFVIKTKTTRLPFNTFLDARSAIYKLPNSELPAILRQLHDGKYYSLITVK